MENELNILGNGRQPHFFLQMEDDLNIFGNKRQPNENTKLFSLAIPKEIILATISYLKI